MFKGLALYYVGFYIRFDPPVSGTPVTAPGYIALIAIYIFAAVYQFGWGPVVWTYCSVCPVGMEHSPLHNYKHRFTRRLRLRSELRKSHLRGLGR